METCTPSELMQIEIVKKRFKRPQEIGEFVKIFNNKVGQWYDARTSHIPKDTFISFLTYIENYSPPKSCKPNPS